MRRLTAVDLANISLGSGVICVILAGGLRLMFRGAGSLVDAWIPIVLIALGVVLILKSLDGLLD